MGAKLTAYMGDLALILVTMVWGSTFVVTKWGLDTVEPFTFLAIRFGIAFIILLAVFRRKVLEFARQQWWSGLLIGLVLFGGYGLQTVGLQYTSASKSGFITGMSVVLTPILANLVLKQQVKWNVYVGAILAFAGLAVLGLEKGPMGKINVGDVLTFIGAVAFALHIVLVGRYAAQVETGVITTLQIGVVAVFCTILAFVREDVPSLSANLTLALFYMGSIATALVLFLQNWAQQFTSPSRTAIIFTLEPVFAALFAVVLMGESLGASIMLGGILILAGVLLAELKA